MDFVTIIFNDPIELSLLKLQAYSFKFVDLNMINNIYIVFNDLDSEKDLFIEKFKEIKKMYPEGVEIKIVYLQDLNLKFKKSDWFNQQIIKLEVSKIVESDYYILLDGKNHFVRNISLCDFIDSETNRPILFVDNPGTMLQYYYNCLEYYGISHTFPPNRQLLTTTPFVIKKKDCQEMLEYIENREKKIFASFFRSNLCKYTEFYLYSTYLLFTNKINDYIFKPPICICIFNADPSLHSFNAFENKKVIIDNDSKKVFGLHRAVLPFLDETYKSNLLKLYSHFYSEDIVQLIQKDILESV